jgi:hypothetical protein
VPTECIPTTLATNSEEARRWEHRRHDSHPVVEGNKTFPCRPDADVGNLRSTLNAAFSRIAQVSGFWAGLADVGECRT